jgi:MoxR-like ATPase
MPNAKGQYSSFFPFDELINFFRLSTSLRNRFIEIRFQDFPVSELAEIIRSSDTVFQGDADRDIPCQMASLYHELKRPHFMSSSSVTMREIIKWIRRRQTFRQVSWGEIGFSLLSSKYSREQSDACKKILEVMVKVGLLKEPHSLFRQWSDVTATICKTESGLCFSHGSISFEIVGMCLPDPIILTPQVKKTLVEMAIAVKHQEPILLVGGSSYKSYIMNLWSSMQTRQTSDPILPSRFLVYLRAETESYDLLGQIRPSSFNDLLTHLKSGSLELRERLVSLWNASLSRFSQQPNHRQEFSALSDYLGNKFPGHLTQLLESNHSISAAEIMGSLDSFIKSSTHEGGGNEEEHMQPLSQILQLYQEFISRICVSCQISHDHTSSFMISKLHNLISMCRTCSQNPENLAFVFQDGPVTRAAKMGIPIYLEEFDAPSAAVTERLNSMLETTPSLSISEDITVDTESPGTTIRLLPSFQVFATLHLSPGRPLSGNLLSPAAQSRFTILHCSSYDDEDLQIIVEHALNDDAKDQDFGLAIQFFFEFIKVVREEVLSLKELPIDIHLVFRVVKFICNHSKVNSPLLKRMILALRFFYADEFDESYHKNLFRHVWNNKLQRSNECPFLKFIEPPRLQKNTDLFLWSNGEIVISFCEIRSQAHHLMTREKMNKCLEEKNIIPTVTMLTNLSRIFAANVARAPLLLIGPPGIGKTSVVLLACSILGYQCERINLSGNTTVDSLIGSMIPTMDMENGGRIFKWHPGALVRALIEKKWILFDEINLAPPEVLDCLVPLLSQEKYFSVPFTGEVIDITESRIFATMNPSSIGGNRRPLPRPVKNLFSSVLLSPFTTEELFSIFQSSCSDLISSGVLNPTLVELFFRIHLSVQEAVHERKVGMRGGAFEFNLRTLLQLTTTLKQNASDRQFSLMTQNGIQNLDGAVDLQVLAYSSLVEMIYGSSFQSIEEQKYIRSLIIKEMKLTEGALNEEVRIDSSGIEFTRIGSVYLKKGSRSKERLFSSVIETPGMCQQMQILSYATQCNRPILVEGDTCSAKTTLIQHLAALCNQELVTIPLNHDTETSELVGQWLPLQQSSQSHPDFDQVHKLYQQVIRFVLVSVSSSLKAIDTSTGPSYLNLHSVLLDSLSKLVQIHQFQKVVESEGMSHLDPLILIPSAWSIYCDFISLQIISKILLRCRDCEQLGEYRKESDLLFSRCRPLENRLGLYERKIRENLQTEDISGGRSNGVSFVFLPTPLIDAMVSGKWVLFDNLNSAPPEVVERLNSLFEDPPFLSLYEKSDGGIFNQSNIHPNFRIFCTANVGRIFSNKLSSALLNRCIRIWLPTLDSGLTIIAPSQIVEHDLYFLLVDKFSGLSGNRVLAQFFLQFHREVKVSIESNQIRPMDGFTLTARTLFRAANHFLSWASSNNSSSSIVDLSYLALMETYGSLLEQPSSNQLNSILDSIIRPILSNPPKFERCISHQHAIPKHEIQARQLIHPKIISIEIQFGQIILSSLLDKEPHLGSQIASFLSLFQDSYLIPILGDSVPSTNDLKQILQLLKEKSTSLHLDLPGEINSLKKSFSESCSELKQSLAEYLSNLSLADCPDRLSLLTHFFEVLKRLQLLVSNPIFAMLPSVGDISAIKDEICGLESLKFLVDSISEITSVPLPSSSSYLISSKVCSSRAVVWAHQNESTQPITSATTRRELRQLVGTIFRQGGDEEVLLSILKHQIFTDLLGMKFQLTLVKSKIHFSHRIIPFSEEKLSLLQLRKGLTSFLGELSRLHEQNLNTLQSDSPEIVRTLLREKVDFLIKGKLFQDLIISSCPFFIERQCDILECLNSCRWNVAAPRRWSLITVSSATSILKHFLSTQLILPFVSIETQTLLMDDLSFVWILPLLYSEDRDRNQLIHLVSSAQTNQIKKLLESFRHAHHLRRQTFFVYDAPSDTLSSYSIERMSPSAFSCFWTSHSLHLLQWQLRLECDLKGMRGYKVQTFRSNFTISEKQSRRMSFFDTVATVLNLELSSINFDMTTKSVECLVADIQNNFCDKTEEGNHSELLPEIRKTRVAIKNYQGMIDNLFDDDPSTFSQKLESFQHPDLWMEPVIAEAYLTREKGDVVKLCRESVLYRSELHSFLSSPGKDCSIGKEIFEDCCSDHDLCDQLSLYEQFQRVAERILNLISDLLKYFTRRMSSSSGTLSIWRSYNSVMEFLESLGSSLWVDTLRFTETSIILSTPRPVNWFQGRQRELNALVPGFANVFSGLSIVSLIELNSNENSEGDEEISPIQSIRRPIFQPLSLDPLLQHVTSLLFDAKQKKPKPHSIIQNLQILIRKIKSADSSGEESVTQLRHWEREVRKFERLLHEYGVMLVAKDPFLSKINSLTAPKRFDLLSANSLRLISGHRPPGHCQLTESSHELISKLKLLVKESTLLNEDHQDLKRIITGNILRSSWQQLLEKSGNLLNQLSSELTEDKSIIPLCDNIIFLHSQVRPLSEGSESLVLIRQFSSEVASSSANKQDTKNKLLGVLKSTLHPQTIFAYCLHRKNFFSDPHYESMFLNYSLVKKETQLGGRILDHVKPTLAHLYPFLSHLHSRWQTLVQELQGSMKGTSCLLLPFTFELTDLIAIFAPTRITFFEVIKTISNDFVPALQSKHRAEKWIGMFDRALGRNEDITFPGIGMPQTFDVSQLLSCLPFPNNTLKSLLPNCYQKIIQTLASFVIVSGERIAGLWSHIEDCFPLQLAIPLSMLCLVHGVVRSILLDDSLLVTQCEAIDGSNLHAQELDELEHELGDLRKRQEETNKNLKQLEKMKEKKSREIRDSEKRVEIRKILSEKIQDAGRDLAGLRTKIDSVENQIEKVREAGKEAKLTIGCQLTDATKTFLRSVVEFCERVFDVFNHSSPSPGAVGDILKKFLDGVLQRNGFDISKAKNSLSKAELRSVPILVDFLGKDSPLRQIMHWVGILVSKIFVSIQKFCDHWESYQNFMLSQLDSGVNWTQKLSSLSENISSTVREVDLSNRDTVTALKNHVDELEDFLQEGMDQGLVTLFSSTAQFLTSLISCSSKILIIRGHSIDFHPDVDVESSDLNESELLEQFDQLIMLLPSVTSSLTELVVHGSFSYLTNPFALVAKVQDTINFYCRQNYLAPSYLCHVMVGSLVSMTPIFFQPQAKDFLLSQRPCPKFPFEINEEVTHAEYEQFSLLVASFEKLALHLPRDSESNLFCFLSSWESDNFSFLEDVDSLVRITSEFISLFTFRNSNLESSLRDLKGDVVRLRQEIISSCLGEFRKEFSMRMKIEEKSLSNNYLLRPGDDKKWQLDLSQVTLVEIFYIRDRLSQEVLDRGLTVDIFSILSPIEKYECLASLVLDMFLDESQLIEDVLSSLSHQSVFKELMSVFLTSFRYCENLLTTSLVNFETTPHIQDLLHEYLNPEERILSTVTKKLKRSFSNVKDLFNPVVHAVEAIKQDWFSSCQEVISRRNEPSRVFSEKESNNYRLACEKINQEAKDLINLIKYRSATASSETRGYIGLFLELQKFINPVSLKTGGLIRQINDSDHQVALGTVPSKVNFFMKFTFIFSRDLKLVFSLRDHQGSCYSSKTFVSATPGREQLIWTLRIQNWNLDEFVIELNQKGHFVSTLTNPLRHLDGGTTFEKELNGVLITICMEAIDQNSGWISIPRYTNPNEETKSRDIRHWWRSLKEKVSRLSFTRKPKPPCQIDDLPTTKLLVDLQSSLTELSETIARVSQFAESNSNLSEFLSQNSAPIESIFSLFDPLRKIFSKLTKLGDFQPIMEIAKFEGGGVEIPQFDSQSSSCCGLKAGRFTDLELDLWKLFENDFIILSRSLISFLCSLGAVIRSSHELSLFEEFVKKILLSLSRLPSFKTLVESYSRDLENMLLLKKKRLENLQRSRLLCQPLATSGKEEETSPLKSVPTSYQTSLSIITLANNAIAFDQDHLSLFFDVVPVQSHESTSKVIRVTNKSVVDVNLKAFLQNLSDEKVFEILTPLSFPIKALSQGEVTVKMSHSFPGKISAKILLEVDEEDHATVELFGEVQTLDFTVGPTELDFGTLLLTSDSKDTRVLSIRNNTDLPFLAKARIKSQPCHPKILFEFPAKSVELAPRSVAEIPISMSILDTNVPLGQAFCSILELFVACSANLIRSVTIPLSVSFSAPSFTLSVPWQNKHLENLGELCLETDPNVPIFARLCLTNTGELPVRGEWSCPHHDLGISNPQIKLEEKGSSSWHTLTFCADKIFEAEISIKLSLVGFSKPFFYRCRVKCGSRSSEGIHSCRLVVSPHQSIDLGEIVYAQQRTFEARFQLRCLCCNPLSPHSSHQLKIHVNPPNEFEFNPIELLKSAICPDGSFLDPQIFILGESESTFEYEILGEQEVSLIFPFVSKVNSLGPFSRSIRIEVDGARSFFELSFSGIIVANEFPLVGNLTPDDWNTLFSNTLDEHIAAPLLVRLIGDDCENRDPLGPGTDTEVFNLLRSQEDKETEATLESIFSNVQRMLDLSSLPFCRGELGDFLSECDEVKSKSNPPNHSGKLKDALRILRKIVSPSDVLSSAFLDYFETILSDNRRKSQTLRQVASSVCCRWNFENQSPPLSNSMRISILFLCDAIDQGCPPKIGAALLWIGMQESDRCSLFKMLQRDASGLFGLISSPPVFLSLMMKLSRYLNDGQSSNQVMQDVLSLPFEAFREHGLYSFLARGISSHDFKISFCHVLELIQCDEVNPCSQLLSYLRTASSPPFEHPEKIDQYLRDTDPVKCLEFLRDLFPRDTSPDKTHKALNILIEMATRSVNKQLSIEDALFDSLNLISFRHPAAEQLLTAVRLFVTSSSISDAESIVEVAAEIFSLPSVSADLKVIERAVSISQAVALPTQDHWEEVVRRFLHPSLVESCNAILSPLSSSPPRSRSRDLISIVRSVTHLFPVAPLVERTFSYFSRFDELQDSLDEKEGTEIRKSFFSFLDSFSESMASSRDSLPLVVSGIFQTLKSLVAFFELEGSLNSVLSVLSLVCGLKKISRCCPHETHLTDQFFKSMMPIFGSVPFTSGEEIHCPNRGDGEKEKSGEMGHNSSPHVTEDSEMGHKPPPHVTEDPKMGHNSPPRVTEDPVVIGEMGEDSVMIGEMGEDSVIAKQMSFLFMEGHVLGKILQKMDALQLKAREWIDTFPGLVTRAKEELLPRGKDLTFIRCGITLLRSVTSLKCLVCQLADENRSRVFQHYANKPIKDMRNLLGSISWRSLPSPLQ